jgi:hypothetical protein
VKETAMAIYGRAGQEVTIVRVGTLDDVRKLDGRRPDKQDREAVENGSYVVTRDADSGQERLHHLAFLRADGGSREVTEAIEALLPAPGTPAAEHAEN